MRGALEALADVVPLSLFDDGAALRLTAGAGEACRWPAAAESERPEIFAPRAGRPARRGEHRLS